MFCLEAFDCFRKDGRDLRELSLSRSSAEDVEYWITIGSVYLSGLFLISTCVVSLLKHLKQSYRLAMIQKPSHFSYYDAYQGTVSLSTREHVLCSHLRLRCSLKIDMQNFVLRLG